MSHERVQVVSESEEVVVFDFVRDWGVGVVLETLDAVSTPEQSPGREVLVTKCQVSKHNGCDIVSELENVGGCFRGFISSDISCVLG